MIFKFLWVCGVHALEYTEKSEDNLQESILSFALGPGHPTPVIRPRSQLFNQV